MADYFIPDYKIIDETKAGPPLDGVITQFTPRPIRCQFRLAGQAGNCGREGEDETIGRVW